MESPNETKVSEVSEELDKAKQVVQSLSKPCLMSAVEGITVGIDKTLMVTGSSGFDLVSSYVAKLLSIGDTLSTVCITHSDEHAQFNILFSGTPVGNPRMERSKHHSEGLIYAMCSAMRYLLLMLHPRL